MIIGIMFIITALITLKIFIYEHQPFIIWVWPVNTTPQHIHSLILCA